MGGSHLYFGDNLEVLREYVPSASVDLVYLDPPFNSNRNYNVIFARSDRVADANQAQIQAFDDTWRWSPVTEQQYHEMLAGSVPSRVADTMRALHALLGENDALAYLLTMEEPTRGIRDAVAHAGTYEWPMTSAPYPRAQVLTVESLLAGSQLAAPPALVLPYIAADRYKANFDQLSLL